VVQGRSERLAAGIDCPHKRTQAGVVAPDRISVPSASHAPCCYRDARSFGRVATFATLDTTNRLERGQEIQKALHPKALDSTEIPDAAGSKATKRKPRARF